MVVEPHGEKSVGNGEGWCIWLSKLRRGGEVSFNRQQTTILSLVSLMRTDFCTWISAYKYNVCVYRSLSPHTWAGAFHLRGQWIAVFVENSWTWNLVGFLMCFIWWCLAGLVWKLWRADSRLTHLLRFECLSVSCKLQLLFEFAIAILMSSNFI